MENKPEEAVSRYPLAMYKGDYEKPDYKVAHSKEEETELNGLGWVNGHVFYSPKKGKK